MKVSDNIQATPRAAGSKNVAHKLRKAGKVPAVAYGPGVEHTFLALDPKEFWMQRQQYGLSHLFDVSVDGVKKFKALIKDTDHDPVTGGVLHVDLYAVDMKKPIRVRVTLELTGKPKGAVDGGLLTQILRSLEVSCLPGSIPEKLTADVSPMEIGASLHMSDIPLPEGVKFTSQHDEAIATVLAPEEAKEAEAAPAAPGATPAAAPAAEAKKS